MNFFHAAILWFVNWLYDTFLIGSSAFFVYMLWNEWIN